MTTVKFKRILGNFKDNYVSKDVIQEKPYLLPVAFVEISVNFIVSCSNFYLCVVINPLL